jgi:hypothetical protein
MFCPQCSQRQVSEEMRFCSRCGFPLEMVSQLVANAGILTAPVREEGTGLSPRQRGIRKAGIFLILSIVLAPIVGLMTAMKEDFFVLFLPLLMVFIFGLARLLYALFLEQSTQPIIATASLTASAVGAKQLQAPDRARLSEAQSVPIANSASWRQPVKTSEIAQPPSVTDNTTKLLKDKEEEK